MNIKASMFFLEATENMRYETVQETLIVCIVLEILNYALMVEQHTCSPLFRYAFFQTSSLVQLHLRCGL